LLQKTAVEMMMRQLLQLLLLLAGQLLSTAEGSCAAARKCCDGKDPDCVVSTLRQGKRKRGNRNPDLKRSAFE
jgi:hypothetical protein